MLLVVFPQVGLGDVHAVPDFLPDDALRKHLALQLVAVILVAHAGLFLDVRLELVGIGDLGAHLNVGELARHLGIDVDVQILGLLHQQKLVDLVAQRVGRVVPDFFLQLLAVQPFAAETALQIALLRFELSPRDDVAIDFGGNLLDDTDVRRDRHGQSRCDE